MDKHSKVGKDYLKFWYNVTDGWNIFISSSYVVYLQTLDLVCNQHLTRVTSQCKNIPEIQVADTIFLLVVARKRRETLK